MQPAIRVEQLSKRYRLGGRSKGSYRTLRDTLAEWGAWLRALPLHADLPSLSPDGLHAGL